MIESDATNNLTEGVKNVIPEVYGDLAKPSVTEIGNVAGRSVKALLSPLRGLLWGWEKIEDLIVEKVNKKLEKVPEEKRKSPEPEIAVPLIQALQYTAHNATLREMYINLLTNSMDTDKDKIVHPSFVDIIKKMSSLDAKVFEKLAQNEDPYQRVINPSIKIKSNKRYFFAKATPEWYLGWTIEGFNEFDISASIVRLSKFGLIELIFDRTINDTDYEDLIKTPFLNDILNQYSSKNPNLELELTKTDSAIHINEYGMQFKKACH